MAQKFITKRNRHIFRKPVKVTIAEKMTIELPTTNNVTISTPEEVILNPTIEPEVIETEVIEVEAIEETPKKRKPKKVKEVVETTEETQE